MKNLIRKDLRVPNSTRSLAQVRDFVRDIFEEAGLVNPLLNQMILAVDEAVSSIMAHGDAEGGISHLELTVDIDDVRIKVTVDDSANLFDRKFMSEGDLCDFIEGRRNMELGVFLIRKIIDEMTYVYRKGFENQLALIKFL